MNEQGNSPFISGLKSCASGGGQNRHEERRHDIAPWISEGSESLLPKTNRSIHNVSISPLGPQLHWGPHLRGTPFRRLPAREYFPFLNDRPIVYHPHIPRNFETNKMALRVGVTPKQGFGALAAGLLGAAAFPPLGLWPLSLVSIALLVYLLRDLDQGQARPVGLIYGLVYGAGTMYWLFRPGLFGVMAIPLVALMAGYFGLFATLFGLTRNRPPLVRAALVALFAVAVEWLRGDAWYLRFPWYTVPHALAAVRPGWPRCAGWEPTACRT